METPANFRYNTYGTDTCKYLTKWENLTKDNFSLRWPKLDISFLSELIYLYDKLKRASDKIKQPEWEVYFNCYLETSVRE